MVIKNNLENEKKCFLPFYLSGFHLKGQQYSQCWKDVNYAGDEKEISIEGLTSGIYFFRLDMGNQVATKKLII